MIKPAFVHLLLSLELQLGSHVQVGLDSTEILLQDLGVLVQLLL